MAKKRDPEVVKATSKKLASGVTKGKALNSGVTKASGKAAGLKNQPKIATGKGGNGGLAVSKS